MVFLIICATVAVVLGLFIILGLVFGLFVIRLVLDFITVKIGVTAFVAEIIVVSVNVAAFFGVANVRRADYLTHNITGGEN